MAGTCQTGRERARDPKVELSAKGRLGAFYKAVPRAPGPRALGAGTAGFVPSGHRNELPRQWSPDLPTPARRLQGSGGSGTRQQTPVGRGFLLYREGTCLEFFRRFSGA